MTRPNFVQPHRDTRHKCGKSHIQLSLQVLNAVAMRALLLRVWPCGQGLF